MSLNRTKINSTQAEILVQFMEKKPNLVWGKCDSCFTPERKQQLWGEVMMRLNCVRGCTKTVEKWKRAWSDLKKNVKEKVRKLKDDTSRFNGETVIPAPLSPLEKRVATLMGLNIVQGFEDSADNFDTSLQYSNDSITEVEKKPLVILGLSHDLAVSTADTINITDMPVRTTAPVSAPTTTTSTTDSTLNRTMQNKVLSKNARARATTSSNSTRTNPMKRRMLMMMKHMNLPEQTSGESSLAQSDTAKALWDIASAIREASNHHVEVEMAKTEAINRLASAVENLTKDNMLLIAD